ncbi:MAG: hypothetical protein M3R02_24655 [Chloroflexota bacterium]|nr:hypothetical protein [Chloroflexota bacterium]
MSAPTLLADLRTRGVHLDVDGDRIRARFKGRTLAPDLAAVIRANKSALLAHLREEEAAISWRVEAMQQQIPERGAVPFLVAIPNVVPAAGACLSCGDSIELVGYVQRCRLCAIAAGRALVTPAEDIAQRAQAVAA